MTLGRQKHDLKRSLWHFLGKRICPSMGCSRTSWTTCLTSRGGSTQPKINKCRRSRRRESEPEPEIYRSTWNCHFITPFSSFLKEGNFSTSDYVRDSAPFKVMYYVNNMQGYVPSIHLFWRVYLCNFERRLVFKINEFVVRKWNAELITTVKIPYVLWIYELWCENWKKKKSTHKNSNF